MKNKKSCLSLLASFLGLVLLIIFATSLTCSATLSKEHSPRKQFTFSWQFLNSDQMKPRGGMTKGAPVAIAKLPRARWKSLTQFEGSKFDKDRLAILALEGIYRVSFDFIETIVNEHLAKPDRPYQSWGTEYIFVIANEPNFISLQHILVMTFLDENGNESDSMVMKHWRQDWTYEDPDFHVFNLSLGWNRKDTSSGNLGLWSQAVYQVDDSPRYAALGQWKHTDGFSMWTSQKTLRPLPRREFSVRSDYQALWGTNRVTITPSGWVHEEDNLKMVIENPTGQEANQKFKAREAGIARYESLEHLDISPAIKYWERTEPFWRDVRSAWNELKEKTDHFSIHKQINNRSMVSVMFEYAQSLANDPYNSEQSKTFIADTLKRYCY